MKAITKDPDLWRRFTNFEKFLTQVTVFVWIALIGFFEMADAQSYCLSEECNNTATAVLSKMNTDVNPCDDFYQFSCGKFINETEIPEDKTAVDIFSMISDELIEQINDLIKEERPKTEAKHYRLPNDLYKACTDEDFLEKLGIQPIEQISATLGGWPVVVGNSWNSSKPWSWQETLKKFRRLGLGTNDMVRLSISVDLKNSTKRMLDLDQPITGLNREYLVKGFNESSVSDYYDYMVDVAVSFGAEREVAKKELRQSLQFEMDLANISWPKEKRRNASALYNLRSIKQLQESYSYVQWLDYINAFLPEGLDVGENEIINLSVPSYYDDLGKLLQRTEDRVIANYLMWRIHAFSMKFLTDEFRNKKQEYDAIFSGKKKREARWKECVNVVLERLPISVGALYVRKHFNVESKATALEMVYNIRGTFSQMLDDVKWMDDETKQEAKKKLHSMATHIGYPDDMFDNGNLENYYRKWEVDPNKYFQSYLNMRIEYLNYKFGELRTPVNKTHWTRHAETAEVNAFYSLVENSIQFPAGILQGHFFNAQRPKYMNYGAIGYAIGHEITHGFDDQGSQFNGEGNLKNWWHSDTKKAYLEKAKCIIEQYGNYTDKQTGLNLNGINTQGENIADNGGLKEAYKAYNQWVAKNGEEPGLYGLNYTNRQMFWIYAAQTWCSKYRTEYLRNFITTDPHSPTEFRVRGTLSNLQDFSHDFQCPKGASMNPVHKYEVW